MLNRLIVQNLRGVSEAELRIDFNSDLNIITGKNGSGKTTLLKLLWYIISGNIRLALDETPFSMATLETSEYVITIDASDSATPQITVDLAGEEYSFTDELDEDGDVVDFGEGDAIRRTQETITDFGKSLFFPTFRRIEGGFSIKRTSRFPTGLLARPQNPKSGLDEAMFDISRRLSNAGHLFICSISTNDIVDMVSRKYNEATEQFSAYQQQLSTQLIDQIRSYQQAEASLVVENADGVLQNIKSAIERVDASRGELMAGLFAVQETVKKLFAHKGIKINQRFSFGDATDAIMSDSLSAGEKQMLSFICYNAFYSDTVFFIDEPELSLHVDWQRQLFPLLESQKSSNQFIFATHSPFIYSKYPDREIRTDSDRGDGHGHVSD